MNLKMVDLYGQYLKLKPSIDSEIQSVIDSSDFIQGNKVKEFQNQLASYLSIEHVIGCANGTDALQIALMSLELSPGSEVIVPAFTYAATAEVILLLGLTPVWVDVNPDDFMLATEQIESALSSKTKAILPVHLFGQSADMDQIMKIAANHQLYVIEDNAQSIGASYFDLYGKRHFTGTIGTIGTTSFFPSKNLGCFGDGGALFTNDASLAKRIYMICNHGQSAKYYHQIVGVNSRLDTIQAAVLTVKLKSLDLFNKLRVNAAINYNNQLKDIPGLITPKCRPNSTHVYNQYSIQVLDGKRDALKKFLHSKGIPTAVYYPLPLHLQEAYRNDRFIDGQFPVSENLSNIVLSLPMHTELTDSDQDYICEHIRFFFR